MDDSHSPQEHKLILSASEVVKVWKPSGAQDAWNVLWSGPPVMSRAQYCLQLESRLRELIAENPREAKDILPGFAVSNAITSARLLCGEAAGTVSTFGACTATVM